MPIYNAGQQLRLAVLSVLRQTFRDWELLIIDDGSTDNAVQTITDIDDARIRIIRDGTNKGLAARLNEAIDLARGTYFARMDQDDVAYPGRFAAQVAMLDSRPELDLFAVRAISISDENACLGERPGPSTHEQICAQPWKGFYFPHPTWLGRTEWFRTHRYAQPGPFFCEDQELLLRSYEHSRFATVDEILFGYRVRHKIDGKKQLKTHWTLFQIQWRHFNGAGHYRFASLSLLTLTARLARVLLQLAQQNLVGVKPRSPPQDSAAARQWQIVLHELQQRTAAPARD